MQREEEILNHIKEAVHSKLKNSGANRNYKEINANQTITIDVVNDRNREAQVKSETKLPTSNENDVLTSKAKTTQSSKNREDPYQQSLDAFIVKDEITLSQNNKKLN